MIEKHCILCDHPGHHYDACPRVSFWDLVAGTFGLQMPSGKSTSEVADELRALERDREHR
jgi:hypothetical protein